MLNDDRGRAYFRSRPKGPGLVLIEDTGRYCAGPMDLELRGRVALVTGVSRGIGLAVAEVLLAEGMSVLGTSRTTPERAQFDHLSLDMQHPDAGNRAVGECMQRFGRLDLLVNNVGTGLIGTGFASEPDERWAMIWELNFMSAVRTSRAALTHLVRPVG